MLGNSPFYFNTIAKTTAAFGWIFSDISIQRVNPNTQEIKTIKIPIELSTKEKWYQRMEADPNAGSTIGPVTQRPISLSLPRMGYAYKNYRFDPSRKLSSINYRINTEGKASTILKQLNPVPIVVEYSLYLQTRTLEDGFPIIEQIGAFFSPDYVVPILDVSQMNIKRDIVFTLKSQSHTDSYDGNFTDKRLIEWEFEFEARGHLYPPIREKKLITEADITFNTNEGNVLMEVSVDPFTAGPDETFCSDTETYQDWDAIDEIGPGLYN